MLIVRISLIHTLFYWLILIIWFFSVAVSPWLVFFPIRRCIFPICDLWWWPHWQVEAYRLWHTPELKPGQTNLPVTRPDPVAIDPATQWPDPVTWRGWIVTRALRTVLWQCWLGHLTRKNPSPYDLYCVGGTLSLTQSSTKHGSWKSVSRRIWRVYVPVMMLFPLYSEWDRLKTAAWCRKA